MVMEMVSVIEWTFDPCRFAYGSPAQAPAPQLTQYVASGITSNRPYAIGL